MKYRKSLRKPVLVICRSRRRRRRIFLPPYLRWLFPAALEKEENRPFYSPKEKQTALSNLERLGIADLKKSCFRDLSGGQKQRALIARALCATDKLLILDEPITGLDPSAIQDFYNIIRKLNREEQVAILMVSHDMANIVRQAGKILHLQQKALFWGTVQDYLKSGIGNQFLGGEEE